MKYMCFLLFSLAVFSAFPLYSALGTDAGWQRTVLNFGEPLVLVCRGNLNGEPELQWQQPAGFIRSGIQRNITNINGRVSGTYSWLFTLPSPGNYDLPEAKIIINGGTEITVPPARVTLQPPQLLLRDGSRADVSAGMEMLQGEIIFPAGKIYTGMTLPLTLRLTIDSDIVSSVTQMPFTGSSDLQTGTISFVNDTHEEKNGKTVFVYTFSTWVRPHLSGKLDPEFFSPVNVLLASRRETVINIPYKYPDIQVEPLPPVPEKVYFTGAVGEYEIFCNVTGRDFTAGEALTLQVHITPVSAISALPEALDNLTPPEFSWGKCRVYPPEIRKYPDGSAVIEYVFIPLQAGKLHLPGEFAVFNTVSGSYSSAGLAGEVNIAPGIELPSRSLSDHPELRQKPAPAASGIFPFQLQKPEWHRPGSGITFLIVVVFLTGPVAVLLYRIAAIFISRKNNSAERRKAAESLSAAVNQAEFALPEDFRKIMDEKILPALRQSEGLSGGSSIEEIAAKISTKDSELSTLLGEYAAAAYTPGGQSDELAGKFCKAARKYMRLIILLCLLLPATLRGDTVENLWDDAQQLCTAGNWNEGEKILLSLLDIYPRDPALWYDLGICAANSGETGKAVWRFAGANQLAPDSREIMDALNTVEQKAGVPLSGSMEDPGAVLRRCRDHLRPPLWMLIAAICWSVLWAIWGTSLRKHIPQSLLRTVTALLLAVFLCALVSWYTQRQDTYSADRGIITADTVLLTLPGGVNAQETAKCRSGESFKLLTTRNGCMRITTASGNTGWIKEEYCGLLPDSIPADSR